MNIQDRRKTLTVEELRRRYNLDALDKDRKAIQLVKNTINKTEIEFQKYIAAINNSLMEYPNQADGNITAWFFNGIPTEIQPLFDNEEEHLGDLYYDRDSGFSYQYRLSDDKCIWKEITNPVIKETLALASADPDTADNKRVTYITTPITPYNIGDVWINNGVYYRCRASREAGNHNILDWVKSTEYTNDLVSLQTKAELNQFKTQVTENYVSNATLETTVNSITGKVEETYTYVTTVENQVVDITKTTNEIEGSNELYITDSLESNALEYHIEGKSKQDGEPTPDAPIEVKTIPSIINLFESKSDSFSGNGSLVYEPLENSYTIASNQTWYRSLLNVKNGETYTLSFELKTDEDNIALANLLRIDHNYNGSALVNFANNIVSTTSYKRYSIKFTTTTDTTYLNLRNLAGKQFYIKNIQLEKGSIPNDYVPYGAWAKVKITGENLFDGIFEHGNIHGGDGSNEDTTKAGVRTKNYIQIKSSTPYTLTNYTDNILLGNGARFVEYDENKNFIKLTYITMDLKKWTITTSSKTKYVRFTQLQNTLDLDTKVQLQQGSISTEYEPFKEKEVLINLSKHNLFDNGRQEVYFNSSNSYIQETNAITTSNITAKAGDVFTISCSKLSDGIVIASFDENNNCLLRSATRGTKLTHTCPTNTSYIIGSNYIGKSVDTFIYKGENATSYHEICSIEDTKNKLEAVSGKFTKRITKVVLDGSESGWFISNGVGFGLTNTNIFSNVGGYDGFCSHFIFSGNSTAWQGYGTCGFSASKTFWVQEDNTIATTLDEWKTKLANDPITIYYPLATEEIIQLEPVNIPLFDGVNHIILVDNLEATTSIKFLRQTPLSNEYATNQQLGVTNNNLANTTNQTNQNTSDINNTNINLNNNYYNKGQIDVMNISTQEVITQIKNTVETATTATNLQISILQEQLTNGITSVKTETGYTFDKDGLKIQKSDSEMSSLLDNDGLVVKRNETEVLTVRSSGVETENLTVRTYFTIGDNTRVENYKSGTGFFYIGGAN